MGGSVRIPASFCGTVGLKPSLGRIPMTVLPTVFDNISHFGPLARTIDDAALFLAAPRARSSATSCRTRPARHPHARAGDVKGLKIALDMDLGFYAVDDEVAANVEASTPPPCATRAPLSRRSTWAGHARPALDAWASTGTSTWPPSSAAPRHKARDLDPTIAAMFDAARKVDAITLKRLDFVRTRQWQKLCDVFDSHDALICPTNPIPAPPAEDTDAQHWGETAEGKLKATDMTAVFNNVAQCPALSVPSGWTKAGLPTELQIVAHRFDDLMALRIGAAVERLRPWPTGAPRSNP